MQSGCYARIDWAALGAGLIANRDYVGKSFFRIIHVEDCFGLVSRNIHSNLLHRLDNNGIEFAGFKPGAVRLEFLSADLIQERLGHLAAGAIVDANEKDFFLHRVVFG